MMTGNKLMGAVLQLAMQGKIVEQRPEEGTGEELYQKIRIEQNRLIKQGVLKKSKKSEKISDDEKPFDIPESWMWVRVEDIAILNPKNNLDDDLDTSFIPMTLVDDAFSNHHTFERRKWGEIKKGFSHFAEGDIGVAKITPCFQNRKSVVFKNLINGHGAGTTELSIVRLFKDYCSSEYFLYIFKSELFINNGVKSFTGTAGQQRIHKDYLRRFVIPLPPIAEQKRIVAKIEELMPLVEQYAAASTKLNTLNASFPEMMKKSILQEAVQGKLVPQDPNDEPASLLLKRIAREQQELIKSGKLRLSGKINKTAEIELNIPGTWEKAKLKDLIAGKVDNRGKTPLHNSFRDDEYCIDLLEINSLVPGQYITHANVEKFITKKIYDSLRGHVRKDDILIATVGSLGKFSLMDDTNSGIAQNIIAIRFCKGINPRFVFYLLQSPYFEASMSAIKMEAVQASIKVPDLFNIIVPLPPTEEQNRIVEKIDEIMTPVMNELDKLKHQ